MINNLTCFSLCICLSKITQIGQQLLLGPFYISSLELEVLRTAQHLWTPIKKHCPIMLLCFLSNLHLTELLWLMWCGSTVERTHVKESINTRFESGLYQFLPVILVNLSTLSEPISTSVRWTPVALCVVYTQQHLLFWEGLLQTMWFL